MGIISYDLLSKQKARKQNLRVDIDIFPYASVLYAELARIGIIDRVKEVPQLGVIKVSNKLAKTRHDYIMLQLYLHQTIKHNLQGQLQLGYNNYVDAKEFRNEYKYTCLNEKKPSVCDILQLLTIAYNIGHFYNTFTASRAICMLSLEDNSFKDKIIGASTDERYQQVAKSILNSKNYLRLHLLNSILVLDHCDQTIPSVSLTKEIIYSYLNESTLPENSKLKYIFSIFQKVRTVSYLAYDLPVSEMPLAIDLCNKEALILFLKELLSTYNNSQSTNQLVRSMTKLLDDTVYNENSNAICYYKLSRKMVSLIANDPDYLKSEYYSDFFIDKTSILNTKYTHKRDFVQTNILKLTFTNSQRIISEALFSELERIHNLRVGYYDRHSGEQTILVSTKKTCDSFDQLYAAFKAFRCAVTYLRRIPDISSTDKRYLLSTKFFLIYVMNQNPVVILPTIHQEKCVLCTRGKLARINELQSLLRESIGNDDQNHEVAFLIDQLKDDSVNDTSITIPASIIVYNKERPGMTLCEFDGMLIHPFRKTEQIVFSEAKNRYRKPSEAKTCLVDKFSKLTLKYDDTKILTINHDAFMKYTIESKR